jgi:DNA-binding NarL/FixJ family response regulator
MPHSGAEALAAAAGLQPDLVLLDIGMPDMSGLEVAKTLQTWARPPLIVFLSMHDDDHYRSAARAMGVFGFVSKTDFVNELLPIITRLAANGATDHAAPVLAAKMAQTFRRVFNTTSAHFGQKGQP